MTPRAAIQDALRQARRLTSAQIAGATGIEKKQVRAELFLLRDLGLVRCERQGQTFYWRLGR